MLRVQARRLATLARQRRIGETQRRSWELQEQVTKLRKEVEAGRGRLWQPNDLTVAEPEKRDSDREKPRLLGS